MTPELLLCITTIRDRPQFHLFVESFLANLRDFEIDPRRVPVLVVDGILWTRDQERREEWWDAVAGRDMRAEHMPPKPSLWQGPNRITQQDEWDACSARNTAIAVASAQRIPYIGFVDDCMALGAGWIWRALEYVKLGIAVAGTYRPVKGGQVGERGYYEGYSNAGVVDHRLDALDADHPHVMVDAPSHWLYGGNQIYPTASAYHIGGWDELYSGQAGVEDCEFGVRLVRSGVRMSFDPFLSAVQEMNTHDVLYSPGEGTNPRLDPRKRAEGGSDRHPPKNRKLACGHVRYANEYLTERLLLKDLTRVMPLGKHSLARDTKAYAAGEPWPVPTWPQTDWRDGAPLNDLWKFVEGRGTLTQQALALALAGEIVQ